MFTQYRDQSRSNVAAIKMIIKMGCEKIDRKHFIPNNTNLLFTIVKKKSHRFSMSFLVQLTIGAVGCFAATFAQVGVAHPVGLSLAS